MTDFFTFQSFISPYALMIFYAMGALLMPLAAWLVSRWLLRKYKPLSEGYTKGKALFWSALSLQQKTLFVLCMVFCFLMMELFWRMMFEFLIAYMQIRDVLVHPAL